MIELGIPVFILIIVLIVALVIMSWMAGFAIAYYNIYDDMKWEKRFSNIDIKEG